MKINTKATGKVSNQETKKIKLQIGNVGKILSLLRDGIYSNPIQVLVQEYVSNAIDIHTEMGQNRPVEITLPTTINPFFRVRDFGSGLSFEQMEQVYTQYGVSTKDKDNTQQGGFGLGCKSFWAYSKSFFVKTYYNGVATEYLAHLGESDEGDFDIISEEPTNEPNGLEVYGSVQTGDFKEFEQAVFRCSAFMKNQPIIKGVDIPEWYSNINPRLSIGNVSIFSNKDLPFLRQNSSAKAYVVIDNVLYPLSDKQKDLGSVEEYLDLCKSDTISIFPVQIGELEVTPSRDTLKDTKKTIVALEKHFKKAKEDLIEYAKKQSAKCKSLSLFFDLSFKVNTFIDVEKYLTFKKGGYTFLYSNGYRSEGHVICKELLGTEKVQKCYITRNRKGKEYLKKDFISTISKENYLNAKWVYADGSETLMWVRIKYYLLQNPNDSVIVINTSNKKEIDFWNTQLNVQFVGDLERPPKEHYISQRKSKEKVCLHFINKKRWTSEVYRNTTHFNLNEDTLRRKCIYISMTGNTINYEEIADYSQDVVEFITNVQDLGFDVIAINNSVISKIKDNEDFISINDFKNNLSSFVEIEQGYINYAIKTYMDYELLNKCDYVSKMNINDTELLSSSKKLINVWNKVNDEGYINYPSLLQDLVLEKTKQTFKLIDNHSKIVKERFNNYPLLGSSGLTSENQKDYEIYINAKLPLN